MQNILNVFEIMSGADEQKRNCHFIKSEILTPNGKQNNLKLQFLYINAVHVIFTNLHLTRHSWANKEHP